MKSNVTTRRFPETPEEWEALIAEAEADPPYTYDPETDLYDPNDPKAVEEAFKRGFWFKGGGYAAYRVALAEHRLKRQREQELLAKKRGWHSRLASWKKRLDEMLKSLIT